MSDIEIELVYFSLRVVLLLLVPLVIALSLSGILASALQSVIGISEPALNFTFKMLALLVLGYAFSSYIIGVMLQLVDMVYGPV